MPGELAPEDSRCAEHPHRRAIVICDRCGNYACLECWQGSIGRCRTCLERDPAAAAPPIPWEDPEASLGRRLFGTFGQAFRPGRTAPGFAREAVGPALLFALMTAVPLALLRGVIPYTGTLLFGPGLTVSVLGTASADAIALDIARAMGISLIVSLTYWAALAAPYVSLSRVYGSPRARAASLRVVLYRAWLIPITVDGLLLYLLSWPLPRHPPAGAIEILQLIDVLPLVFFASALFHTARLASGMSFLRSLPVVLVPLALLFVGGPLVVRGLAPLLPSP